MFINHVSSKKFGGAERVLDSLVLGVSNVIPQPVLLLQKGERSDDDRWDCESVARMEYFDFGALGGKSKILSLIALLCRIVKAFFYFSYLIRKHRIRVVCANSLIAGAFSALPARLMRTQFIYYEHNIAAQRKNLLIGLALRPVSRLATDIVCISDAVRQSLVDAGAKPDKLHVIHNGYDFTALDGRGQTDNLPDRHRGDVLRIGMVANFIPWKRHERFVEIVDALSRRIPDMHIEATIIGGCLPGNEAYFERIETLVDQYAGKASITMAGFQDNIADYLRSFDVLINPADAEPFGLIFVEAMYLGCVVVGSRDGSSSEIIEDTRTGLVVDYTDIPAVIDRLSLIARDLGARKTMGDAATEDVRRRFSMDQHVASFVDLLG
jgi:glycosyltransferase involved in cell wall biosynthesis